MKVNFITMQSLTELLKTAFSLSIFLALLNLGSLNTRDRALLVNKFFTFLLTNKNAQMHIYIISIILKSHVPKFKIFFNR